MLQNYDALIKILGQEGASERQPEKSLNFYLKNTTGPYSKTEGPVINFLLILFNKRNDIQINNRCRNRHQSAVKAI
mgnify:FL=1